MITHRNGQSVLEYALFIAVVVAALVAMRYYINRGFQGRLRQSSQEIGEGFFYSPGAMTVFNSEINTITNETMNSTSRKPTAEEITGGVAVDPDANVIVSNYTVVSGRILNQTQNISSYSDEMEKGSPLSYALP